MNANSSIEYYRGLVQPLRDKIRNYGKEKKRSIIYHYTKPSGLRGILNERAIYATDYRFLNDRSELKVAPQLANDILFNKLKRNEIPELLYIALKKAVNKVKDFSVYIVSFSEVGNLLSQWRAYSSPQGYSLGFEALLGSYIAFNSEPYTVFSKCIYSRSKQKRLIKEAINFLLERWDENNREEIFLTMIETAFKDFIYHASCFFKDSAFREEREWRIAVLVESKRIEDVDNTHLIKPEIHFRQAESSIVPYMKIPLTFPKVPIHNETENIEKVFRLEKIIVGPSNKIENQYEAVNMLVKELGVKVKHIVSSTIPLKS